MLNQLNPDTATLVQQFKTIVKQYPTHTALISPNKQLSYQQLNEQANQIAYQLQQLAIQSEQLIGLHLELSLEAVIGLWGILKAGGAFVPLEPSYPPGRLQHLLNDTQISIILTTRAMADNLPSHQARLLYVDELSTDALSENHQSKLINSSNLAGCLYTSGSTGQPKGVLLEHQALVKHFASLQHHYQLTPADRVLQFASLTHIAGVEQIIMALLNGASLIVPDQKLWTVSEFLPKVKQYGLTMVDLPASYYQTLAQEWATSQTTLQDMPLRLLIVGGEITSAKGGALWSKIATSQIRFLNVYGMTEVSGTATLFEMPTHFNQDWQSLPIGKPLPNRLVYIVDEQLQPVPDGERGEMCIGGANLARGYLNQPGLTTEKFVNNPLDEGRLYRTGDLGRFLPDGNLEYLSRKDNQVQIRGFRVELGEIEAALLTHPVVKETAVVAKGEETNKQLIAYIVLNEQSLAQTEVDKFQLSQELSRKLPDYMVPHNYCFLDAFPLTANGKIDRQALPTVNSLVDETTFVPPQTQLEIALAQLITELLQIDKVNVQTNFSNLGLNSLHLTQIQNRILLTLNQDIPLVAIFSYPTIQSLASYLSTLEKKSTTSKQRFSSRVAKQKSYLKQRQKQQSKERPT